MTHLHPRYPYVRRLLMAAATMSFAIGPTACKPKVGSQMKAIFSGGKGFALIPARRFTATGGNGPEFENSIRMMMLPVKCSSESEVVTLENFALSSQDGARYAGRSILDTNGVPIPGTKSCAVLGNYALHFWAAQYLFPGNPKNEQEYHRQQWVYLALRGPYNKQNQGAKPPAVEKFFAEAGSVRLNGDLSMLALWDSFFNPCLPLDTAKASGFDKKRHFKCEGTNYRSVSGNPDDATLSTLIANASDSLIYRMANGEFAPVNTAGLETAIRLYAPTGNALGLTGNTGKSAGKTTAKGRFRERIQNFRDERRFVLFGGPFGGTRTSNNSAACGAGNVTKPPLPVQSYVPPQRNTQPGGAAFQGAPPVPTIAPSIVPPAADDLTQTIAGFNKDGYMNQARYEQIKALSIKHDLPVESMLGRDSSLSRLYQERDASTLASNSETPAPVVNMQTINPREQSRNLQAERYNPLQTEGSNVQYDPDFPGWMIFAYPGDETPQYGTKTNYVGPNNERNQRTVVNGVTRWYQQDASGNLGQLLSEINPDGTYSPAGTSSWDGAQGKWVPRTQVPVDPTPPETLGPPSGDTDYSGSGGSFESTGETVQEPPFDPDEFWNNR